MEACKGFLGPNGDWLSSAKAEGNDEGKKSMKLSM